MASSGVEAPPESGACTMGCSKPPNTRDADPIAAPALYQLVCTNDGNGRKGGSPLRRAKWRPVHGDGGRRKVDDGRQARVYHEPVTVGPMIFEVRTGAGDQVEMRFSGRTEHGDQRNGLPPVLADPHHAEA